MNATEENKIESPASFSEFSHTKKAQNFWRRLESLSVRQGGSVQVKRARRRVTLTKSEATATYEKPRLTRSITIKEGLSAVGTEEKKQDFTKRHKIIQELISTEKTYADGLKVAFRVSYYFFFKKIN